MYTTLSKWILRLFGWKATLKVQPLDKCLICVAPHTSNWDFVWGKLGYTSVGQTTNFLIKNEWLCSPIGFFFKSIGGIGVNREKGSSLVQSLSHQFATRDKLQLAITPEGTRARTKNWKKGIYHIAKQANVPIILSYIDYLRKEVCFAEVFCLTGNEEADWHYIRNFYKNIHPKYPAHFSTGVID